MPYIGPREARELAQQNKLPFFPNHDEWRKCMKLFLFQVETGGGAPGTRRGYEGILRWFFQDPTKTPDDYQQSDVIKFIGQPTNGLSKKGTPPRPSTINRRLASLRCFYKFAARYRISHVTKGGKRKSRVILQEPDPTEGLKWNKEHGAQKTLTDDEVQRFFAAIPKDTVQGLRDRFLFLFYFWTGRRKQAILSLRYGDLEQTPFTREDGSLKTGWIYHYREKGGKVGFREMVPPLPQALDAYLVASGRKETITRADPVFVGMRNCEPNTPLSARTAHRLFDKYARIAGIDDRHSIHSFRHTAAARRWKEERDLLKLMNFLDHDDPKTTLRYLEGVTCEEDTVAQRLYAKYGDL